MTDMSVKRESGKEREIRREGASGSGKSEGKGWESSEMRGGKGVSRTIGSSGEGSG